MVTISLDDARADIDALLERVERGEDVLITRQPRRATTSEGGDTMEEALRELDKLRASLPPADRPSAEVLRELRDERY